MTTSEKTSPGPAPSMPLPISASTRRRSIYSPASLVVRLVILVAASTAFLYTFRDHAGLGGGSTIVGLLGKVMGKGKINVILMISDGYGPASETFGRSVRQALDNNTSPDAHFRTSLDEILIGTHRSRSSNSLITDSAAGATAPACGLKTYNGAIGVDPKGRPCGTWFEAAKLKGWLTGLVVTSRLTDATPASFITHVPSRALEGDIAAQLIGSDSAPLGERIVDLAIGGGGCFFLPNSHPLSCRLDDRDLTQEARESGWKNVQVAFSPRKNASRPIVSIESMNLEGTEASLHTQHSSAPSFGSDWEYSQDEVFSTLGDSSDQLPLLALLAPFNTPFEIDRIHSKRPTNPSLAEISVKALRTLQASKDNKKGFVMMIEGSQIDLCAHANDAACHANEILAYQDAISAVRKFVDEANAKGERTLLISTSDHETGGVTLGRQLDPNAYPDYAYYPSYLLSARRSAAHMSAALVTFARSVPAPSPDVVREYVATELLTHQAGFVKGSGGEPSEREIQEVLECIKETPTPPDEPGPPVRMFQDPPINTADTCRKVIANLQSRRSQIGFTTSGHTGVDVPVHASGHKAWVEPLRGNIENTDIAKHLEGLLGVDLGEVTRRLWARGKRHAEEM